MRVAGKRSFTLVPRVTVTTIQRQPANHSELGITVPIPVASFQQDIGPARIFGLGLEDQPRQAQNTEKENTKMMPVSFMRAMIMRKKRPAPASAQQVIQQVQPPPPPTILDQSPGMISRYYGGKAPQFVIDLLKQRQQLQPQQLQPQSQPIFGLGLGRYANMPSMQR